jgi:hypothetical protein
MSARTSKSSVTFTHPFTISAIVGELPAGNYNIEVDEEPIGPSTDWIAYRRLAAYLFVPTSAGVRMIVIDPKALDEALAKDTLLPH